MSGGNTLRHVIAFSNELGCQETSEEGKTTYRNERKGHSSGHGNTGLAMA